jgi:hypothetical protein
MVGLLVVAGSALGIALWHTSSTATRQALVVAGDVDRGHVFTDADFAPASVSAEGMRLVAFADRGRMIGRIAATALSAATPITDSVALEQPPLAEGEGLVGRKLEAGEYPVGLPVGSTVQIVLVVEQASVTEGTPTKESIVLPESGVVEAVEPLVNQADAAVVTLRLSNELARQLASADGVRLIQVTG